jgi:glucose/arabinose dehydrogenase
MKKEKNVIPVEDYGFPITLAFHNDKIYFSERITGRLWEAELNFYDEQQEHAQRARLIKTFPIVPIVGHNETGLIGIAIDPEFASNGYLYCYYTYGTGESDFRNRVVRVDKDGKGEKIILDGLPAGIIHNGGIIAFGPDGKLYIGIGVDNVHKDLSQDISFLGGKVLRINKDGSIPEDNPFPNSPVYSYGHRNIFGIAFHPRTGKLYLSDVGPDHDDEINIVEKGGNYGWPIVMGKTNDTRFINPLIAYTPTITPVQSVFVGDALYFGSFNEGTVHKLTLSGADFATVAKDEIVYRGRPFSVIGVFYGPDEHFYLTLKSHITRFQPNAEHTG